MTESNTPTVGRLLFIEAFIQANIERDVKMGAMRRGGGPIGDHTLLASIARLDVFSPLCDISRSQQLRLAFRLVSFPH